MCFVCLFVCLLGWGRLSQGKGRNVSCCEPLPGWDGIVVVVEVEVVAVAVVAFFLGEDRRPTPWKGF